MNVSGGKHTVHILGGHTCLDVASWDALSAQRPIEMEGDNNGTHPYFTVKDSGIVTWCPYDKEYEDMMNSMKANGTNSTDNISPNINHYLQLTFKARAVISKVYIHQRDADCENDTFANFTIKYTGSDTFAYDGTKGTWFDVRDMAGLGPKPIKVRLTHCIFFI